MMQPTLKNLRHYFWGNPPPMVRFASGSLGPYGNPRHYKHFWQVFIEESPWESDDFFEHAPRLCNAQFEAEIARLQDRRLPCLVYGWRLPRKDPANPFDMNSARWKDATFAPCWDEDTDPVVAGGHK